MLPGAMEGIKFLFVPQWEKLYEPRVWYAAVTQSFFSMGVGFGSIITFSSYNKFNHNIYKDATIIAFADTFTSTLAGVITFSILGHLAYELDSPISDVIKSGTGLAFISYPEVVAKFEMAPQLFAVLFFLMLITLGLGSAVGMINVVITVLNDACPGLSKSVAAGLVCLAGAVVGIVFTTPGGQPLLELVDYYGGSMLILVMALMEVLVLTWVYGRSKLIKDMNFMMERQLGVYWKFCWFYFIPVTLSCILAYTLVCYKPVEYAHAPLPLAAQISGWLIFLFGVMVVIAFMIKQFIKQHSAISENGQTWLKTIWSAAGSMFKPLDTYGPAIMGHRIKWLMLDDQESAGNINFAIEKESPRLEIHTISKTVEM
jgi:solute carrier family 6 amino acid transporter-like protein 5/7/9/14